LGPATPPNVDGIRIRRPSWLDLVERWFAELTNKKLRRSTHRNVAARCRRIVVWAAHWNDDAKPVLWQTPANKIIAKVRRGRAALSHKIKSGMER
jgi:hypothetical protein